MRRRQPPAPQPDLHQPPISLSGRFVDQVTGRLVAWLKRPLASFEMQLVTGALADAADHLGDRDLASMVRGGSVSTGHVLMTSADAQVWASALVSLDSQPTDVPTWRDETVAACSLVASLREVGDAIDAIVA